MGGNIRRGGSCRWVQVWELAMDIDQASPVPHVAVRLALVQAHGSIGTLHGRQDRDG